MVAAPCVLINVSWLTGLVCSKCRRSVKNAATWFCSNLLSAKTNCQLYWLTKALLHESK